MFIVLPKKKKKKNIRTLTLRASMKHFVQKSADDMGAFVRPKAEQLTGHFSPRMFNSSSK